MRTLSIDIETYSSVDLTKSGVYRYVEAPDFSILLLGYAFDDSEVKVLDLTSGEELPPDVMVALCDPNIIKTAYNANFEITCIRKAYPKLKIDASQWECTQVKSLYCGLPGYLEGAADALGLDEGKMNIGKTLITYFSKPCKPTKTNSYRTRNLPGHDPDKWALYKEYNKRDVEVEMEVRRRLAYIPLPKQEQALWVLDYTINNRGLLLDNKMIIAALEISQASTDEMMERLQEITGLENPNSAAQLKKWLGITSLTKETVKELIESTTDPVVKEVLELRQAMAKTSIAKYDAMQKCVCSDGRVRGLLQFYGANRTGRWAGRLVQVHNLPKNNMEDLDEARQMLIENTEAFSLIYDTSETLSQLIRTAFVAEENKTLLIADYSAIEARVIAWYAKEQWRLDVFAGHGKIYEASASQMFKIPIEEVTKELRAKGKVSELALGYNGSSGALTKMGALKMGLTEEELPGLVSAWRNANRNIVKLWKEIETLAMQAVATGKKLKHWSGLIFGTKDGNLHIVLPSGRALTYQKIKIIDRKLTYAGMNQETKKWERTDTYGGKLVENIVQATARDCLAENMLRLDQAGFEIVMHIHDEVVIEGYAYELNEILEIMKEPIDWAPGLQLNAEGYYSDYYRKD